MSASPSFPARVLTTATLVLAAALAMVLAPAAAPAATASATTTKTCDTYNGRTSWARSLALPRFNPSLGTFVSAEVTQSAAVRSDLKVESTDGSSYPDATFSLTDTFARVQAPGTSQVGASIANTVKNHSFSAFDGAIDYAGTSGWTTSFGDDSAQSIQTTTDAASWSGAGSVSIPVSAGAKTSNTLSGNNDQNWATVADVTACVAYTYLEQVLVCVGDYVWVDANKNGIQDAGETPVGGQRVTVTDSAGNVLGTTTTDASGRWTVCGLEPSTPCVITIDIPDGYTVTGANAGDDSADSDGTPTASGDATIACMTPPRGSDLSFDVGIYPTPAVLPLPSSAPAPAVLRAAKRALLGTINSGGRTTFTVTIRNAGSVTVGDVTVCDTPPAALAFTSKPRGAFFRSGKLCWRITTLAAGKSVTFRYTMRAASVTRRSCVINRVAATAAVGGSAASRATVCIRPTKLKALVLAG